MRLRSLVRAAGSVVVLAAGLLASAVPARAVTGPAGSFAAVRTAKPPPLDAALTDPVWDQALAVRELQTITTQQPSAFGSQFLLLYDDTNLYVGMRLEQRGAPVTATQSANGLGFGLDDFAGIGIDPSGNAGQVYFFMANPLGTRWQQSSESVRFAPPWTAVAARTAEGWNAMLVIPVARAAPAGRRGAGVALRLRAPGRRAQPQRVVGLRPDDERRRRRDQRLSRRPATRASGPG